MVERTDMRVSDRDRQAAADRLKAALDDGRLTLLEYDSRLNLAYQSATYGELDPLFDDLPAVIDPHAAVAGSSRSSAPRAGLPVALKVLWTVWAAVFAVSLTVWTLVSLGNGEPDTFWPQWGLVPGAALVGVTAVVQLSQRGRRTG